MSVEQAASPRRVALMAEGDAIKERQEERGLTQSEAATELGIPYLTYVQYVQGRRRCPEYLREAMKRQWDFDLGPGCCPTCRRVW